MLNSRVAILGGRDTHDNILLSDFPVSKIEHPSIQLPSDGPLGSHHRQTTVHVEISKMTDAADSEDTSSSMLECTDGKCLQISV